MGPTIFVLTIYYPIWEHKIPALVYYPVAEDSILKTLKIYLINYKNGEVSDEHILEIGTFGEHFSQRSGMNLFIYVLLFTYMFIY